jgi:hypothetical protein
MIEVKDVLPHPCVVKLEPRKKEGLKKKKELKKKDVKKVKEDVASVKTKEEKPPVKTKKNDQAGRQARAQDGAEVGTQDCNARKER